MPILKRKSKTSPARAKLLSSVAPIAVAERDVDLVAMVAKLPKGAELIAAGAERTRLVELEDAWRAEIRGLSTRRATEANVAALDRQIIELNDKIEALQPKMRRARTDFDEALIPYCRAVEGIVLPLRRTRMDQLAVALDEVDRLVGLLNICERELSRVGSRLALIPWRSEHESSRARLARLANLRAA